MAKLLATFTTKEEQARQIQVYIEEHYGFDVASSTRAELRILFGKLGELVELDVELEELDL